MYQTDESEVKEVSKLADHIVTADPGGFIVESGDRNAVTVELDRGTRFLVSCSDGREPKPFGLYDYYKLSAYIGECLVASQEDKGHGEKRNVARTVGREVHCQWKRLLDLVEAKVLAVQKTVFSTTKRAPTLLGSEDLYREEDIVHDVLRYRAAAMALGYIDCLRGAGPDSVKYPSAMYNWRGLFSPTGYSYGNLEEVLNDLPGGLSYAVCELRNVVLERASFTRLELAAILRFSVEATKRGGYGEIMRRDLAPVLMAARDDEIRGGMRLVGQATNQCLTANGLKGIGDFLGFLVENWADSRPTSLAEWTRACIEHYDKVIASLEANTRNGLPLGRPGIPVPAAEGVALLQYPEDVARASQSVGESVLAKLDMMISGDAVENYVIRVDRDGDTAVFVVSDWYPMLEKPCSQQTRPNSATRYGSRILGPWKRQLVSDADRRRQEAVLAS